MSNGAVGDDTVVTITYALYDDEGDVLLEEIGEGEALTYLHGHHNVVPGLEEGLSGKGVGDSYSVVVPPEKAYGEHKEELVTEIERSQLPIEGDVEEGDNVRVASEGDRPPEIWKILELDDETVKVDANQPLAGMRLRFEGEILEVREPTDEELEAGRPLE